MKTISLMLAFILSLNSIAWADPETVTVVTTIEDTISEEREAELFKIANDNPAEAFAQMTDAEFKPLARWTTDCIVNILNVDTFHLMFKEDSVASRHPNLFPKKNGLKREPPQTCILTSPSGKPRPKNSSTNTVGRQSLLTPIKRSNPAIARMIYLDPFFSPA
jgi:hypothetical protein